MPTINTSFLKALFFKALGQGIALALGATLSVGAFAQDGALAREYPELARLNNAFDVTQAALYDAMAEINASPETMQARMETQMELE